MDKITTRVSWFAVLVMLAACALPPAPPPRTANTMTTSPIQPSNLLAGTQWVLASLNGNAPVAGTQVTLNFITESRAAGSDGCNRFNGSYTVAGNALSFGPMAGTMMACPPGIMTQATAFNKALAETKTFAIANDTLTLSDASGVALAAFDAQNTALAGTKWNVTNYNNGRQAVVGLLDGTALTVGFGEDGRVAGNAGCNNYFGPFTQGEGTIALGPLASTKKLCPEPAGVMDQEAQFLKALESAATYHLDGDKLDLRTKDDALAVVLRRAP
jgi:heat shock protein HslJ